MATSTASADKASVRKAFAALAKRFGDRFAIDQPTVEHYARTAMPSAPSPIAVIKASTKDDVLACLDVAREFDVPLYPISGGKNWGLGSACPTTEGQIVLDLSGMNRILEVNEELGYAVIEPGVTQGQLYQHLQDHQIDLWLDATGAGPDATILGNLMERGYGHTPNGDRFHNSCAFEVALADGTLIQTGWGHHPNSRVSNVFKTGMGPSIDGLFTQSNLGIVLKATIWLIPRPTSFAAYAFRLPSRERLAEVIDALRPLRSLGVINSVVHLANDYRIISSHMRFPYDQLSGDDSLPESERTRYRNELGIGHWNVLGGIYGTPHSVRGTCRALKSALRGIAKPIIINDRRLALFDTLYPLTRGRLGLHRLKAKVESARAAIALLKGQPVADHLAGSGWRSRRTWEAQPTDPLDRNDGIIWLTPLVPLSGTESKTFLNLIEPVFAKHGFEPLLTFVMISSRVMCCPTTICYDRESETERLRAQACYAELLAICKQHGFLPYRAGIQTMASLCDGGAYWEFIRKLKSSIDPQHIIAPGRY